ncbi:MAG TPA: sulfurtransferase [Trueperaceae bacterium]|nr:sulfurtransferase [Trueperaceae bacterium]
MKAPSSLISPEELVERLAQPQETSNLRLIDARYELSNPSYGAAAYAAGTLPGAVYLGLEPHLAGKVQPQGGRHPLPDMDEFVAKLGALGIGDEHEVVVFDDAGVMYAARAWWLLRYAGKQQVRFLDGGLAAYLAAGGQLVAPTARQAPAVFTLDLQPDMAVDVDDVAGAIGSADVQLIDARAPERYRGDTEPLDPKAGHIPGAANRFFMDNMTGGRFAAPDVLHEKLALAGGKDEVVAYCGSGVSAAHLVLALELAGYSGAKLYVGSWSDWSSRDLPVATGE